MKITNSAIESNKGINAVGNINFNGGVTNTGNFTAGNNNIATNIKGDIANNSANAKLNANNATFSGKITNTQGNITANNATFSDIANSGTISANGSNAFNIIATNANSNIVIESGKSTFNQSFDNVANANLTNKDEMVIVSGKTLTNNGTFNGESGSKFNGKMANNGTMVAESNSTFSGAITNNATLNANGAIFSNVINESNGTFNATGANIFSGIIENKGILNAESSSVFSGAGTITNSKTLNAKGATFKIGIKTEQNSNINISGANLNIFEKALINNGNFDNQGKVKFLDRFTNYGNFSNVVGSEIAFENGAEFAKQIINNGTITTRGENIFTNGFDNKGTLNANGATFKGNITTQNNSKIIIDGTKLTTFETALNNNGDFANNGKVKFLEKFTNNGTFSNVAGSETIFERGAEFTKTLTNRGYLDARNLISISTNSTNETGGRVNLNSGTLKIADNATFTNNGNFAFSFINGMSKVELGTDSIFKNTDSIGKVEINLKGLKVSSEGYQIIAGKDDSVTISEINAILKESDIIWLNGSATYLNGKIFVSEIFSNLHNNSSGAINTPIIATNRANVASMNNLFLASNAVMSSHHKNTKFRKMASINDKARNALALAKSRNDKSVALDSLESNEIFFYNSQDSQLFLADSRIKARVSSTNRANLGTNQNNDNFFFLLTPFANHTSFKAMGDYQISGLDYGFISAFGGKVSENHTLGAHFAFDYAKLGDKNDKSVNLSTTNLMAGLNYRADLAWDMYVKTRGDFYYFLNEVNSSSFAQTKPNNLGFGVSVAYGKDFDFKQGGILGIELGLDYKIFHTGEVSANDIWGNASDEYKSASYHLLYLDLGLNYYKYFSTDLGLWGLDAGLEIRGNLTPKVSNGTLMVANRAVDITLDSDNVLGYVSVGGSYVVESTKWAMEFTLRYNGSFGDKSISNGGSFEWRVRF